MILFLFSKIDLLFIAMNIIMGCISWTQVVHINKHSFCGVKTTDKYDGVETLLLNFLDFPENIITQRQFRPRYAK